MTRSDDKVIRNCVNCGVDNSETIFTFTRDFLVDRGWDAENLDIKGFGEETTSSIVKCKSCGCNYIRDVFVGDDWEHENNWTEHELTERLNTYQGTFSWKHANHLNFESKIIEYLLKVLAQENSTGPFSLLDFGASFGIMSSMARVMGFDRVVSYDPHFRPNIGSLISNNHPINVSYIRKRSELLTYAPFDVIVCQSADEHFFDPARELIFMNELLRDKGILYITHPIMDLDTDIADLRNEKEIRARNKNKESSVDKFQLIHLRKSYHIDHLQYIMPEMFVKMILQSGFKEMKVGFRRRQLLEKKSLHVRNVLLLVRSLMKFWFYLFPWNLRKVEHVFRKVTNSQT